MRALLPGSIIGQIKKQEANVVYFDDEVGRWMSVLYMEVVAKHHPAQVNELLTLHLTVTRAIGASQNHKYQFQKLRVT